MNKIMWRKKQTSDLILWTKREREKCRCGSEACNESAQSSFRLQRDPTWVPR